MSKDIRDISFNTLKVFEYILVKESWLVYGLYDAYCQSGSARCLQVLLDVRDPHERFLLDKITEGLKQQVYLVFVFKNLQFALTVSG